jgi:L,D-transpeptidase catalytic domain
LADDTNRAPRCRRFPYGSEGNPPKVRVVAVTLVLAFAGTLAVDLEPGSAPQAARPNLTAAPKVVAAPKTVEVTFVRNGRLVRVERVVPKRIAPERHALRELLRGPTRQERARGLRSAFRPGAVRLRFVLPEGELWLVRFSRGLLGPATAQTMRTRLAQVSATLARLGGPRRFGVIAAEGRLVTAFRLGMRPEAWRPERGERGYLYSVRGIQLRLWTLGYLDRSDVNGSLDYVTSQALLAFQGWEGLARTGSVTGPTQVELFRASRPKPTAHRRGSRIEIHRDRGVLLLLRGNELERAVHTSTGAGGMTPAGSFRVYRKELYSWSVPFQVWMPFAAYFVGGIATHEYPDVPSYPASHGCVRLPAGEAHRVYGFVEIGTPVNVF